MYQCEYCGTDLPERARFCGNCGRTSGSQPGHPASSSGFRRVELEPTPDNAFTPAGQPGQPSSQHWVYDHAQSNDEDEQRRAAMLGMGLLTGADAQVIGSNVPVVQGTPQIGEAASVANTPPLESNFLGGNMPAGESNWHAAATDYIPYAPTNTPPVQLPRRPIHMPNPKPLQPPHSKATSKGCAPTLLIVAVLIPILIIGSIITLGFTVFAPGLSLSGSSSVSSGGTLSLHGNHFLPGSSITLTLDNTTPLYVDTRPAGIQTAHALNAVTIQSLSATVAAVFTPQLGSSTISAGGDGTFSVNITVSPNWSAGQHTIQASEAITHRSAELTFTIIAGNASPTPSTTGTVTPTVSPSATLTASPTVTATLPAGQSGLSCINPSSVTLGPVSVNYSLAASTAVTLCTAGTGSVNWTASWNQAQASWLSLDQSSGTISAPGQAQINVSANAGQLAAGKYNVTITFSDQSSNLTESLNVTFIVQAGCIKGSPATLSFIAILHVKEAAPQSISLANCGAVGAWSATAKTSAGANWLIANPPSGTLGAGAPTNVSISASTLNSTLTAGKYTGTVTFAIGSSTFVVNVTFTVQAGPILAVTPTRLIGTQQCRPGITYVCFVTLTNTSKTLSLPWTVTANNMPGTVFKPSGATLLPGQSARVEIDIPLNDCATGDSITFSGPGNSVT